MSTENSKTREPHKFVLNFSQSLDLRSSNNNDALQNSPILLHLEKYKTTVQKQ